MQIEFESAYILHARPYRDTSLLINFFCRHYGRLNCVVRGVRKAKSSKRNLLNPFQHLLISFQGNSELKLLTQFELAETSIPLEGRFLLSGFYLNEVMMRLLPEQDTHETLFNSYEQCLKHLALQLDIEATLRRFELELLRDLGYAVSFEFDARSFLKIIPSENYYLIANEGFINENATTQNLSADNKSNPNRNLKPQGLFSGKAILAIGDGKFSEPEVLAAAKKITRHLLQPLLGDKPLVSRELFTH